MKQKISGITIAWLAFFTAIFSAHATTLVWTNTTGGDWNVAVNWSPAQVPGNGDDVIITNSGTYIVTNGTTATLNNLTLGGTNGTQTLSIASLTVSGVGLVNSNGVLNWVSGSVDGALTVAQGGTLSISNNVYLSYANAQFSYTNTAFLTNHGTVIWAGSISSYANPSGYGGGAIIYNAGLWQAVTDATLTANYGGTNIFINTGTLRKTGGSGVSTLNCSFNNTGKIETPAGSFSIGNWIGLNTAASTFNLSGGTIGGTLALLSNAVLNLSGGAIGGTAIISSNSVLNWSGNGSLDGSLTVAPGGVLSISNGMYLSYINAQLSHTNTAFLTNYGTVILAGNVSSYANPSGYGGGAVIYNAGLWQVVADNNLTANYGGTNLFINAGSLQKTGGSGLSTMNWVFNNSGGTLLTSSGSFSFPNWIGNGLIHGNATISDGILIGTIASNAVINWTGGSVNSSLTVAPGGTLTISNNVYLSYINAQLGYTNTAFLTNYGTVIWAASISDYGNPSGYGGGAIIYNAGLWQAVTDSTLTFNYGGGPHIFINVGTLQKTGGTSVSTINLNFLNNGGTLSTLTGQFGFANWTGNGLIHGNASVSGTLSGTVASGAVLNWTGGSLDNALTVVNGGTLTISNSVYFSYINAQQGYTNTAYLTNYGTVIWAGSISSYANPSGYGGGGVIYNAGLWQSTADTSLSFSYNGGTNLFINIGSLEKTGGSSASSINWNYVNLGGTLNTPTGSFTFANWTGNGLIDGNASVSGTLSGIVASNTVLNWIGGSLDNALTVAQGGTLTISNSVYFAYINAQQGYTNTAYLTNYGTVVWAGAVSSYANPSGYGGGGIIYNAGLWQAVADNSLSFSFSGTNLFINVGSFEKIGGSGASTIYWPFNDSGLVKITVGNLTIPDLFVQTGGLTLLQGGNLQVAQGYYLASGTLAGTNTVIGNVTNNGVVSPGLSPGKLTISGSYTQTTNGAMKIELAGTDAGTNFDLFTITGSASLAGVLNVTLTNQFYPLPNALFTFLNAISTTGIFDTFNYPSNDVGMTVNYAATSATIQVINVHPVLPFLSSQTLDEQTLLTVNAAATDADTPPQTLTYWLTNSPVGATISASGVVTWSPTEAQGPTITNITVMVKDNGTPNLTVSTNFQVTVNEINVPPLLTLPANSSLNEQTFYTNNATATDADLPANVLTFALVSGPTGLNVSPAGAITWLPTEAQGSNSYTIFISVTDTNPPAVNAKSLSVTNSFNLVVNEINLPPVLTVPLTQTITEENALNVSASATDPDLPLNPLTFSLISPPIGMTINAGNGAISWAPNESQGSNTYTITVVVTDTNSTAINTKSFSVTNTFNVVVNESNRPPVLTLPGNQTINELTFYTNNATATDADLPVNALTFALVSGPTGMVVNAGSGAITWTPSEFQAPATNVIFISVTDTNPTAINAKSFSVTNSFTLTVSEVNLAPVVGTLNNYSVNAGQTIAFTASATDTDLPTNTLTFTLISPPAGASITSEGLFNWRVPVAFANSTNTLSVRVTDNGTPNLSGTNVFTVLVNPLAPLILTPISYTNGAFKFQVSGTQGPDYIILGSSNLVQWSDLFTNSSPLMPFPYTDTNTPIHRFYRARLSP